MEGEHCESMQVFLLVSIQETSTLKPGHEILKYRQKLIEF